jgi:VIT1/CCC1 family predicted Fe2+/Mn2+ transporter
MAAISSFWAFVVGAFIPLLPWLWSTTGNQIYWSIALAGVGAAGVGGAIGWFTRRGIWRCAIRQLVIAALASAVTFLVGRLVGAN